ncbi:MAG: GTPase [Planctomycetota bacterium]
MNGRCAARLATPPGRPAALAVITLHGDECAVDRTLSTLCGIVPAIGTVAYTDLGGIDRGVVVRWSAGSADLTPHGGPGVVRALLDRLCAIGVVRVESSEPGQGRETVLAALGRCRSPIGLDRLLRELEADAPAVDDPIIRRLWDPPFVAAVGPANVGKSSLLNAMAGRSLALAYDHPGVTRDAVGADVLLEGLAVRWLDTPGLGVAGDDADEAAAEVASRLVRDADLLLVCGDRVSGWPEIRHGGVLLRVATRADLGVLDGADAAVSADDRASLDRLARLIRSRLVPDEALAGGPGMGGAP